jgi:hypothetical protein
MNILKNDAVFIAVTPAQAGLLGANFSRVAIRQVRI